MSKGLQSVARPPEAANLVDQRDLVSNVSQALSWRLPVTVLLMFVVLPVLLVAAALTLPVLLVLAVGEGLRRALVVAPVLQRVRLG